MNKKKEEWRADARRLRDLALNDVRCCFFDERFVFLSNDIVHCRRRHYHQSISQYIAFALLPYRDCNVFLNVCISLFCAFDLLTLVDAITLNGMGSC